MYVCVSDINIKRKIIINKLKYADWLWCVWCTYTNEKYCTFCFNVHNTLN